MKRRSAVVLVAGVVSPLAVALADAIATPPSGDGAAIIRDEANPACGVS